MFLLFTVEVPVSLLCSRLGGNLFASGGPFCCASAGSVDTAERVPECAAINGLDLEVDGPTDDTSIGVDGPADGALDGADIAEELVRSVVVVCSVVSVVTVPVLDWIVAVLLDCSVEVFLRS